MGTSSPAISVAVIAPIAVVKVCGRANFALSVDFKRLVSELRERGIERFIIDLGECATMDSTFLGVLAGLALRNIDGKEAEPGSAGVQLDLLNPNPRVADLLDNLGVIHLFTILKQETPCTLIFEPVREGSPPSKEELSRNCLQAHLTLMDINPENVPKFKDVARFFEEDLKREAAGGEGGGDSG